MTVSDTGQRPTPAAHTLRTTLRIGAERTEVCVLRDGEPLERITLELGVDRIAAAHFRHAPPTSLEIENAIVMIEDDIMRVRHCVPVGSVLQTDDAAARALAHVAGVPEAATLCLTLEAVERQFDLLAALVQGRPASIAGIPTDVGFAAHLLILREFMHHLGFDAIGIDTDLGRSQAAP